MLCIFMVRAMGDLVVECPGVLYFYMYEIVVIFAQMQSVVELWRL